jgi:hypothetical protein
VCRWACGYGVVGSWLFCIGVGQTWQGGARKKETLFQGPLYTPFSTKNIAATKTIQIWGEKN